MERDLPLKRIGFIKEKFKQTLQRGFLAGALLAAGHPPAEQDLNAFLSPTRKAVPIVTPYHSETIATKEKRLAGKVIGLDPGHHEHWNVGASATKDGEVLFHPTEEIYLTEHQLNLRVASKLKGLLEAEGATVCVTRTPEGDLQIPPYDFTGDGRVRPIQEAIEDVVEVNQPRIDFLNQCGAQLAISIHFNGFDDPTIRGTEVYYSDIGKEQEENRILATFMLEGLLAEMQAAGYPAVNRGVKSEKYQRYDRATSWRIWNHYGFGEDCEDCSRLIMLGNNPMAKNKLEARHRVLVEIDFLSSPLFVEHLRQPGFLDHIAQGLAKGIINFHEYLTPSAEASSAFLVKESTPPEEPEEITRGNLERPEMALTFDCGAGAAPTPAILEALRAENISATFFLTGQWAQNNPELVKIIAQEHEIANHSFFHPDFTKLGEEEIIQELERSEELILNLTGKSTKPYWRAPFGARDPRVMAVAARAGWAKHIFWTIEKTKQGWVSGDSGDWRDLTPKEIKDNILKAASLGNGVITVSHCGSQLTAISLPPILESLKGMGLQPTTISSLLR